MIRTHDDEVHSSPKARRTRTGTAQRQSEVPHETTRINTMDPDIMRNASMTTATANYRGAALSMADFTEAIVRHYRENGAVRDTLKLIRRVLRILEKEVGVRTVAALEHDEIDDLLRRFNEHNAHLAPHTQVNRERMLHAIIRQGHELDLLRVQPHLPALRQIAELPKGKRTLPPAPECVQQLMNHLASDDTWRGRRLHTLTSLVLLAKISVTVATRLRASDVDLPRRTIWCRRRWRGKSLESVVPKPVRISDDLAQVLEAWIPLARCEWLIPGYLRQGHWSRLGGVIWTPLGRLKAACRDAGIPEITFEQLRRFHAEQVKPHLPFATIAARVILKGRGEAPIVEGTPVPRLTSSQFNVVKALIDAGEEGLSWAEITRHKADAVKTLKRLVRTQPHWAPFFNLAEKRGARYYFVPAGRVPSNSRSTRKHRAGYPSNSRRARKHRSRISQ